MLDLRCWPLVVVAAALAVAGCATTETGQPAASGPSSSAISFPSRPASHSVQGVDPCTLLSAGQLSQLNLLPGNRIRDEPTFHQPVCGFQLQGPPPSVTDVYLTTVTNRGIEYWLNPTLADTVKQVSVSGFPAVDVTAKASAGSACETAISVADGQMVVVNFPLPPKGTTRTQACTTTEQTGAAVMATLQSAK